MSHSRIFQALCALALCASLFAGGCSEESDPVDVERDTTPPSVTASFPVNAQTDVTRNGPYWILFSEAMDESSITVYTTPYHEFNMVFSGDTLIMTPYSQLDEDSPYQITVDGDCADLAGNEMGSDHNISFRTTAEPDNIPPWIVSTSPVNGAQDVSPTASIVILFSEPMDHHATENAIVMAPEPDQWDFLWESTTLTIIHAPFPMDAEVTVTITTAARDLAGNFLSDTETVIFTTLLDEERPYLASATPANGATGVSTSLDEIVLNFSEPMFPYFDMPPENIDARMQMLVQSEPTWNGDYSTLTVSLMNNPQPGCTYWVVFQDITDAAGNPIDPNPTRYDFTTSGSPSYFMCESGEAWFTNRAEDEFVIYYIDNYNRSAGTFDIVQENHLGEVNDIWHMKCTGSEVQHLGVDIYDDGQYNFTMTWGDPIPYIKLPMQNHLDETWDFSSTVDAGGQEGTIDVTIVIEAETEDITVDYDTEDLFLSGTFADCVVHHLYVTINEGTAEEMEVHEINWFSPGVWWIQKVGIEEGHEPDTLTIFGWDYF
jgi:hypothetical protein